MIGVACSVRVGLAQRPDSTSAKPVPGAFVGFITRVGEKAPVQSADVRLYWIDSMRVIKDAAGATSLDASIDTARSRLAVSNADGYFAVWRLPAGRYLMQSRRIGFEPV